MPSDTPPDGATENGELFGRARSVPPLSLSPVPVPLTRTSHRGHETRTPPLRPPGAGAPGGRAQEELPRLRHERHHRARPARRAGRPQARAPPDPLRHVPWAATTGTAPTRSPPASWAMSWASTTPTATRPSTTPSCAWPRTSPCATRSWTARATSAPSTATRRPPCGTPKSA